MGKSRMMPNDTLFGLYEDIKLARDVSSRLKSILLFERDARCERCGGESWQMRAMPLDMHHSDKDPLNNTRGNLKLLCPNCHAQCHRDS